MSRLLLALDQGTTSSRALIIDESGRVRGAGQHAFPQQFPQPGWVEHDPEQIWQSQLQATRDAVTAAGISAADFTAAGITNQRETTVLWERATGKPVYPAIVWQCRRTAAEVEALRGRGLDALIRVRTGLVPDAYFSATKIAWMLDHVPGARAAAERGDLCFGTVDSWLLWRLTGGSVHATDITNASRTMLLDLDRGAWDAELMSELGIPAALLPVVRPSISPFGEITPDLLGAAVPILGIAGDQQAALFGQACLGAGMAKNTYGTGCFLLMHTGERRIHTDSGLLATAAASVDSTAAYALEGSVFVAGAAVQWLRDGLGIIRSAAEVEPLARSVPDSGGVVVVPAFTGLGAPHWDMYARGGIFGLTRGASAAHIARATLESIALQSLDVLELMERVSGEPLAELRVDGGAAANNLLMQLQADLLGRPVVRPDNLETTALGAAYLAGLGAGIWKDTAALSRQWQAEQVFQPAMAASQRTGLVERWREAVGRVRGWANV